MKTIGTFFELGGRNAVESIARSGLDYIIIDNEHGNYSEESIADCIVASENSSILPYVRVGDKSRMSILHMLDVGARAIVVPNVHSVSEVKELVSYSKFPPLGNRGYCPNRTTGWESDESSKDVIKYMDDCNKRCKLITQCETREALEHIEEICSIEGVDGIFVGPCDLSIELGIPLEFSNPILINAIKRILKACKDNNKEAYIFVGNMEDAKKWSLEGFDSIAYSLDASILIDAYKNIVNEYKGAK